jgi:hypothetical protein
VLFGEVKIVGYHFGNHFVEGYFGDPTEVGFCFGGVTKKGLYFCGTEVPRINPNDTLPGAQRWVSMGRVDSGNSANFLQTHSFPANGYADPEEIKVSRAQRFQSQIWCSNDSLEKSRRRTARVAAMLFPILQRPDANPHY